jgi:hypothetical protein
MMLSFNAGTVDGKGENISRASSRSSLDAVAPCATASNESARAVVWLSFGMVGIILLI